MKRLMISLLCLVFLLSVCVMQAGAASRPVEKIQVDVLIIGGGGAGLAAGAAAKEQLKDSGRVLIIEKNSITGGNSANINSPIRVPGTSSSGPGGMMMGGQTSSDPQEVADSQYQKMIEWTHWRLDAPLVRALILKAQDTSNWMWSLLTEEEQEKMKSAQSQSSGMPMMGGGQGGEKYSVVMTRICKNLGVEIMTNTKGTKILTDKKTGAVVGAMAEGEDKDYDISASCVVIATGGFIGNLELMKKFFFPADDNIYDEIYIKGNKYEGDGIRMAEEVGASMDAAVAFETTFEAIPWAVSDANALKSFVSNRNAEIIWVDGKGKRYANESEQDAFNARQGLYKHTFYMIFDENIREHIVNKKSTGMGGMPGMAGGGQGGAPGATGGQGQGNAPDMSGGQPQAGAAGGQAQAGAGGAPTGMPGGMPGMMGGSQSYDTLDDEFQKQIDQGYAIKTNSLDELAKFIGCDVDALKATIEEYNKGCEEGYDNLMLKDASYLVAFNKAPYYAIRNKLAIHLTHGPIRVTPKMEVVDTDHDPIPGLYAAGNDVGGTDVDTYAGVVTAHSSGWAFSGGRIAGESAAEFVKAKKK